MIVNVRGTNGSGKSQVIRNLIGGGKRAPFYGLLGYRQPEAYRLDGLGLDQSLFVLGPYQTNTGGCDCVHPYDLITSLLNKYEPAGHVIFEGSLISDNYGRIGEWLTKRGRESIVAFLDTPLELCLQRLRARTEGAGEKNVERRFEAIARVRQRSVTEGVMRVVDTSSQDGAAAILALLKAHSLAAA